MSENISSGNSRGKQDLSYYKPSFIDDTTDNSLKLSIEREYESVSNAFLKVSAIVKALEKRISELENP